MGDTGNEGEDDEEKGRPWDHRLGRQQRGLHGSGTGTGLRI